MISHIREEPDRKPSLRMFNKDPQNPIVQNESYDKTFRPSLRNIQVEPSEEQVFHKKTLPKEKKFSNTQAPIPLKSGGIFPEDARIGRKCSNPRPHDNDDVIKYQYSGGICPQVESHFVSKRDVC